MIPSILAKCYKLFVFGALAVNALPDIRANIGGDKIFKFSHKDAMTLDIGNHDIVGREDGHILIKSHPDQFSESKLSFEDVTEQFLTQWESDHLVEPEGRELQSNFFAQYKDLDELTFFIQEEVSGSNGLATRKTIGTSIEGRPIHVVEIGDQTLPLVYILCNVHAREWLTPMYCAHMIKELVADGGHEILDTFSFALVPTGNPDGYVYSRTTDAFWRKTRNVNPSSGFQTCFGTDMNRNWANNHCGTGTSDNPCSDIFCGPEPFSAPETLALEEYAKSVEDRMIAMNDVHSFGAMWLSPLGFTRGTPPAVDFNRMDKCMRAAIRAASAVDGERFISGPAADVLGPAAGASDDHFYFNHDIIYSFTLELRGSNFQPNPSNIIPSNNEIFAGMIAEFECIAETEGIGKFGARETPGGTLEIDVSANLGEDKIINIAFRDWNSRVIDVVSNLNGDSFGLTKQGLDFRFSPDAIETLVDAGISFEDSTDFWVNRFQTNLDDPSFFCSGSVEDCSGDSFYESYQDIDAILARVESAVQNSDNAELISIGESFEGRDIKMVEIGNDGEKPIGFVICTIHAREWLSPMFCTHLIESLLTEGHPLLEFFTFSIVPVANPDGYVYSTERDNMWRKTRMPNEGSRCIGTDGNRNWDNNHCGIGSSTDFCSQVYCGKEPFDQPEVAALSSYTIQNVDRVMVALDIHSYGNYMIHPFGYTEVLPVEEDYVRMRQCASLATEAAGNVTGNRWEFGTTPQVLGYSSGGTSKDWFYGNLGIIYAYTIELRGNGFQPRPQNIKISNDEAFSLFEAAMDCAKSIEIDGIDPEIISRDADEENSTNNRGPTAAIFGLLAVMAVLLLVMFYDSKRKQRQVEVRSPGPGNETSEYHATL